MIEASSFWGGPSFALPTHAAPRSRAKAPCFFASGENVDFEAHVDGDLYDYVGGAAETV